MGSAGLACRPSVPLNSAAPAKRAAWLAEVAEVGFDGATGDDPGVVVQAPGTTGTPKQVEHSRAVLASVDDTWSTGHGAQPSPRRTDLAVAGPKPIVEGGRRVGLESSTVIDPLDRRQAS